MIKIAKCENGHYYDSSKYARCPYCQPDDKGGHYAIAEDTADCDSSSKQQEKESYIFVSYAHADFAQVREILGILDRNGYSYWYDKGIKSGFEWTDVLHEKIKNCAQFLLIMSRKAEQSHNVCDEVYVAQKNNKSFVIVFLEDFELDSGLDIMIGRKQRIIKPLFSDDKDFEQRLCSDLSDRAKKNQNLISESREKIILSRIEEKYEILNVISEKKRSKTLLGKNRATGIPVFIKFYIFDDRSPDSKIPFQSEINALTICISPYLPQLLDVYEENEYGYIVENYLDGQKLSQISNLSEREALEIMIQLAHAVECLHQSGMIHCDIKMNNVIISRFSDAFLIDLNSSLFLNKFNYRWSTGTAGYAAPEQYERQYQPDVRTDIYSLGKTFQYMLQGHVDDRFECSSPKADTVCTSVLFGSPYISAAAAGPETKINPHMERIIKKMTAEKKDDRYSCVAELKKALENCRLILELEERLSE